MYELNKHPLNLIKLCTRRTPTSRRLLLEPNDQRRVYLELHPAQSLQVDAQVERLVSGGDGLPVRRELPEVVRVDYREVLSRCGPLGVGRDEFDVCDDVRDC